MWIQHIYSAVCLNWCSFLTGRRLFTIRKTNRIFLSYTNTTFSSCVQWHSHCVLCLYILVFVLGWRGWLVHEMKLGKNNNVWAYYMRMDELGIFVLFYVLCICDLSHSVWVNKSKCIIITLCVKNPLRYCVLCEQYCPPPPALFTQSLASFLEFL